MSFWTTDTVSLLALIVIGAVFLMVHLVLSFLLMRTSKLHIGWRLLAWLPPVTPVAGYKAGRHLLSLWWWLLAGVYLVLRTQA